MTSFCFTEFKIKHQTNGNYYLIIPFICKKNIFLLNYNKNDNNINNKKIFSIYEDSSIKIYIKISKNGKKHKYFGKEKYVVILEELNNDENNDFIIDIDYDSSGTDIVSIDSYNNDF